MKEREFTVDLKQGLEGTHSISRGFSRGLFEYSDFFRDHWLRPQHIGDVRREYTHCGLELGLETGSYFNPSRAEPIQRASELQSFRDSKQRNRARASEEQRNRYENQNTAFYTPSAGVGE